MASRGGANRINGWPVPNTCPIPKHKDKAERAVTQHSGPPNNSGGKGKCKSE